MRINIVSLFLWTIFFIPILKGVFSSFTKENIRYSLGNLFSSIEFLVSLFLSFFLTKKTFFDNAGTVYETIYNKIPEAIRAFLYGNDFLTYLIAVPVLFIILTMFMRVVSFVLNKLVVNPMANILFTLLNSMGKIKRKLLIGLSNVPKSLFVVFLSTLLLNFMSYYVTIPILSTAMNQSRTYQFVCNRAIYPILNSNIAKKIPVIVNDTFRKVQGRYVEFPEVDLPSAYEDYTDGKVRVIRYFNGVTLDEAIKSTDEIDKLAREITRDKTNDKDKAYLLYEWITKNIKYDYEKVAAVSKDPSGITSGTITAFETGKGICFDFSCLCISMCRAAGLKVRLVTGLAYSGITWGDHAWNQVYIQDEERWINVDTTFGTQADYFDKPDFDVDHKYATIQGEW